MFSRAYIAKCMKYKEDIHHMVSQARGWVDQKGVPLEMFRVGDHFHHPSLMEEGAYKTATEVKPHSCLYAEDPAIPYPVGECILLPNEELLRHALLAVNWSVGSDAYGKGHEYLLDMIIKSGRFET